jgi:hypothetical protein
VAISFTHPTWGSFNITLDAYPSLSVNHTIAYASTNNSAVRQINDGIDAILGCTTARVCGDEEVTINRASYRLTGTVTVQKTYRSVWWNNTMTDKAKAKLDDDPTLNDALLAFVEANLDTLRHRALADYQRRVQETVKALHDNADAIYRAVMLLDKTGV